MVSFGDIFKKEADLVGNTVLDVQQEEKEIAEYKEVAAEKGEDLFTVATNVLKIKEKHKKKREEMAHNTSSGKPVSISVDLSQVDTKIEKEPKKTITKPPKKISNTSGKDSKTPKVSKTTKEETVKGAKPYKTQAGDVTASSEDPAQPYTSLAIIALIGGAIGLAAYFYLR